MIKLKYIASCILALSLGTSAVAQTDLTTTQLPKESLQLPMTLDHELEQLLQRWYEGYERRGTAPLAMAQSMAVPNVHDSVYINMMNRIPSAIRLSYNPIVRQSIEIYLYRRRPLLSMMLSLSDLYFPDIEAELDRNKLPLELKYLTIVESALNPSAISPAGAAGLWQFMLPTARIYGLSINSLVDERMDPIKSTEAACKMLSELYRVYKDWWLVMAAYNCGPGNVNKAIARAGGGRKTFWEIYSYLPSETRKYVPLYIGVYYAMHYHKHYGIQPRELGRTLATEYYEVKGQTSFNKIASLTGLSVEQIKAYNPQFRRGLIPWSNEPHLLRLPLKAVLMLEGLKPEELASAEMGVIEEGVGRSSGRSNSVEADDTSDKQYVYHRVQRRETVEKIATRYGVRARDIREWNNIGRRGIRRGQRIIVGVKEQKPTKVQTKELLAHAPKDSIADTVAVQETARAVSKASTTTERKEKQYVYHKVQRKETLAKIASKYGVRERDLREWNGFSRREVLRRGQNIIVGVKEVAVTKPEAKAKATSEKTEPKKPSTSTVREEKLEAKEKTTAPTGKHIVRKGESLISIAMRYNMSVTRLRELNKLKGDAIAIGDELIVNADAIESKTRGSEETTQTSTAEPKKERNQKETKPRSKTYKVQKGDTPYGIALKHGISLEQLRKWNKLKNDKLQIGDELKVAR